MVSKKQISFVRSLHQKKFRQMYGKFLVEGDKPVRELLASDFKVYQVFAIEGWQPDAPLIDSVEHIVVSPDELRRMATLENPKEALAVAETPHDALSPLKKISVQGLVLCLDRLNDPGNAGTIIRLADWFGLTTVFFSKNSVDVFTPKTVSAAKGSLFRVNCRYADLKELFATHPQVPVYGAALNGKNVYTAKLPQNAFLIVGNEANGISEDLRPLISDYLTIPSRGKAESLNAGVATGIIVSEFCRRTIV